MGFCPALAQDARRLGLGVCSHGSRGRRSSDITTRAPGAWPAQGPGAAEECIFTPGQINTLGLIKWLIALWTVNLSISNIKHFLGRVLTGVKIFAFVSDLK